MFQCKPIIDQNKYRCNGNNYQLDLDPHRNRLNQIMDRLEHNDNIDLIKIALVRNINCLTNWWLCYFQFKRSKLCIVEIHVVLSTVTYIIFWSAQSHFCGYLLPIEMILVMIEPKPSKQMAHHSTLNSTTSLVFFPTLEDLVKFDTTVGKSS